MSVLRGHVITMCVGVWIEEIPVVGVEVDAFDVDALGSG